MSIVTRTGDNGTTGLMYNRRVPKSHPRVEAYGAVDELNAALGLARATGSLPGLDPGIRAIQADLVVLMGELATAIEDRERYVRDGFKLLATTHTASLDVWVRRIEAEGVDMRGWATPGGTLSAATLDVARTTCRRAERRVHGLLESGELPNTEILVYLNRLSDLLWLLARWVETQAAKANPPS
ncbi:MAG: cob(I)yrinic acid a,c-diamide adenosyltransferase [Verrucomicrobia bacterium]|nr:MAG: cob(I)yrinic acid a,c-diamide adenosyltransferase [Verrucomicrobiota bacterium]